jgi:DNA-binding LacI/PurR family transcriptional regulator
MAPQKNLKSTPTIREVAEKANVSPATVSRVLNGYIHVSDEVRQNVLATIEELGFKPNRTAQRLRASQSQLIGIVVTDITNPFFNTIMAGIEETFFDQGYGVLMSNTSANIQKEADYISMMKTEGVAGLVVAPTSENVNRLLELAAENLPIVIIDRRIHNPDKVPIDVVLADNLNGAYNAVQHLIEAGHTRIGFIGGPQYLTSGRERYQGYEAALAAAGMAVEPEYVCFGDHLYQSGYEQALGLLELVPLMSAMFVGNNMMTLGALTAIHHRGLRIPEDIAVVGFDDTPWAASLNPPLTAVAQPTMEIGSRAAQLLLERIARPHLPARVEVLATELRVRASSGGQ